MVDVKNYSFKNFQTCPVSLKLSASSTMFRGMLNENIPIAYMVKKNHQTKRFAQGKSATRCNVYQHGDGDIKQLIMQFKAMSNLH